MNTGHPTPPMLAELPADRSLVHELAARGYISRPARDHALELLYPARSWGTWISLVLSVLGVALVLAGVIYFFAFNWSKIGPAVKLGSIELSLVACLAAAFVCNLQRSLPGKMLLMSASVLTGVFFAVFGQIYQTGADAYNLFMMWGLVILPWTIMAEFGALWVLWLVVVNTFAILWWTQGIQPAPQSEYLIWTYLGLFNGTFLALREYLAGGTAPWLENRWTRVVLVLTVLLYALIPTMVFIAEPARATYSIFGGAVFSAAAHAVLFVTYRFKRPDTWALACTVLSACLIVEAVMLKAMAELFGEFESGALLVMGVATLGVFTLAIVMLRTMTQQMEAENG